MPIKVLRSSGAGKLSDLSGTVFPQSRWNFWEEGVSSSLLSQFLSCREQFRLSVIEGWKSHDVPLALSFGTCMHWCLEQAYARMRPPGAGECKKLVGEFEKVWKRERPNAPQRQLQVQEMAYGLAESVLPSYFVRWAGDFKGRKYPVRSPSARPEKWLALEERFKVPYVYPDGKKTYVVGARDGLFQTPKGYVRVFDSKCLSVINEEDMQDSLPKNLQQMLYLWATWKERKSVPQGTTMNIIRRPGHRRGSEENLSRFFARVAKDVANPKRWDHYFIRIEMDVTSQEVKDWQRTFLDPVMMELRMWWEGRVPHYMNPGALITKYGRCSLFNIIVNGNCSNHFRRERGKVLSYHTDVS